MKNSDLNELQPIYIRDSNYSTKDEISMIDLARLLVKYKKLLIITTLILFSLGTTITVLTPKTYTYTASVEVGSRVIDGAIQPFESPQTLLAKIQYIYIPQTLSEQRINQNKQKTYKTIVNVPKDSKIIVVEVKGTENDNDILTKFLQEITTKTVQDSQLAFNAIKTDLTASKERAIADLNLFNTEKNSSTEKKNTLKNEIKAYEIEIANLTSTREILSPIKSTDTTETSNTLIIFALAFASVFISILFVFLAEFIRKVNEKLI